MSIKDCFLYVTSHMLTFVFLYAVDVKCIPVYFYFLVRVKVVQKKVAEGMMF